MQWLAILTPNSQLPIPNRASTALVVGRWELAGELRCQRQMNNDGAQQRFDVLMAAIGRPSVAGTPIRAGESPDSADTQRIATTQIDELLRRVAALTGVLGAGDRAEWDDVDRLAAQLLLADLAAVASTTRALNALAASRLTAALADLVAARRDAERTVQEAG